MELIKVNEIVQNTEKLQYDGKSLVPTNMKEGTILEGEWGGGIIVKIKDSYFITDITKRCYMCQGKKVIITIGENKYAYIKFLN